MAERTVHRPNRSSFSSSMTARGERPPEELDRRTRILFKLNLDAPAEVITFGRWSPDPWTIVGTNSANLATFSGFVLSVIKAQTLDGQPVLFYMLNMKIRSDGWSPSAPDQLPTVLRVRLDFSNASGGLLATFTPPVDLQCGTDTSVRLSDDFAVDVFSQIASAHLSLAGTWFWPC